MFWGYIIYSESRDRYYGGSTEVGVEIRVDRHNDGLTRSTKSGVLWELRYVKRFRTKSDALKWERMVKRQKSRKFIEELLTTSENEFKG